MKIGDSLFRQASQGGIKLDFAPAFALCMEHRPSLDGESKHFLQAKGLRAKLRVVVLERSAPTFFVFDWDEAPVWVPFHNIAFSGESLALGPHRQSAQERDTPCHFVSQKIGMLMRKISQHGMLILLPPAFDGFESRTSRAVKKIV